MIGHRSINEHFPIATSECNNQHFYGRNQRWNFISLTIYKGMSDLFQKVFWTLENTETHKRWRTNPGHLRIDFIRCRTSWWQTETLAKRRLLHNCDCLHNTIHTVYHDTSQCHLVFEILFLSVSTETLCSKCLFFVGSFWNKFRQTIVFIFTVLDCNWG